MRAMIHLLQADESTVESARAAGLVVEADTEVDADLPVAVDLSAYRIVQEALTNVVKHAPGARASVTVGRRESTLVVEVTNENPSSTVESGNGHGLLNMRERAQAVGCSSPTTTRRSGPG
jgi:signal transduction histidine kinase